MSGDNMVLNLTLRLDGQFENLRRQDPPPQTAPENKPQEHDKHDHQVPQPSKNKKKKIRKKKGRKNTKRK